MAVIAIVLILLANANNTDSFNTTNDLLEEYNKHLQTYNDDLEKHDSILSKYNRDVDLDARINIVNEYINHYNYVLIHHDDFYNFITANEDNLKKLGIDTFQDKKSLKDNLVQLNNNITQMKNDIQEIIDTQEQTTQLQYDLLKGLLGVIAGLPI